MTIHVAEGEERRHKEKTVHKKKQLTKKKQFTKQQVTKQHLTK